MYYKKIKHNNTIIEFHNNWLGEEYVIVNGQNVSKKFSWFGTQHPFTVMENGSLARYVLVTKTGGSTMIMLDLFRDGEIVHENVTIPMASRPVLPGMKEKKSGQAKLQEYDLPGAMKDFEEALQLNPKDPEVYFHLACVYSIEEEAKLGFEALKKSVELGLTDLEAILNHDMLAYLRMHPSFEDFLQSGYQEYKL